MPASKAPGLIPEWFPDLRAEMTLDQQLDEFERVAAVSTPVIAGILKTAYGMPLVAVNSSANPDLRAALEHSRQWVMSHGGGFNEYEEGDVRSSWVSLSIRGETFYLLQIELVAPVPARFQLLFDAQDDNQRNLAHAIGEARQMFLTDDNVGPDAPEDLLVSGMMVAVTSHFEKVTGLEQIIQDGNLPVPAPGEAVVWPADAVYHNEGFQDAPIMKRALIGQVKGRARLIFVHRESIRLEDLGKRDLFSEDEGTVLTMTDDAALSFERSIGPKIHGGDLLGAGWTGADITCAVYNNEGDLGFNWMLALLWRPALITPYDALGACLESRDRDRGLPIDLWVGSLLLARTARLDMAARLAWLTVLPTLSHRLQPLIGAICEDLATQRGDSYRLPDGEDYTLLARSTAKRVQRIIGPSVWGRLLHDAARFRLPIEGVTISMLLAIGMSLWMATAHKALRDLLGVLDGAPDALAEAWNWKDEQPPDPLGVSGAEFFAVESLAILALLDGDPPPGGQEPDSEPDTIATKAAWAWVVHCVQATAPMPETTRAWLYPGLFKHDWYIFWQDSKDLRVDRTGLELSDAQEHDLTAVAADLLGQLGGPIRRGPIVGRFDLVIPPGFPALAGFDIRRILIDALRDGWRWIKVSPASHSDRAILLPWRAGDKPPVAWRAIWPDTVRWELHLALLAWERDMTVSGPEKILFHAATAPALPPPVRQRGREVHAPRAIQAPRPVAQVIRLLAEGKQRPDKHEKPGPVIQAIYGRDEDQAEITRRLMRVQDVQAHSFRIVRQGRLLRASDQQRAAFNALPLDIRLERFGMAELPPEGVTIRGLRLDESGQVIASYQRGHDTPETQPRPVYAAGLLAATLAVKTIMEREELSNESD